MKQGGNERRKEIKGEKKEGRREGRKEGEKEGKKIEKKWKKEIYGSITSSEKKIIKIEKVQFKSVTNYKCLSSG